MNAPRTTGNRGLELPLTDAPLLLCIGDSYTYGDGVASDESWPHFLGQYLPQKQVVNAGILGANLADMRDALHHYQERRPAEHVFITILDIDVLRLSGQLRNEDYFMSQANYELELEQNCTLLDGMLEFALGLSSGVSVTLWGRDIFITRFHRLAEMFASVCAQRNVPFRSDMAKYMSVLSYSRFRVAEDNGHPGVGAHRMIARRMFDIYSADHREFASD